MIYLKKFNESLIDVESVQKFCEENLAFLLDDGFQVNSCEIIRNENVIKISFNKVNEQGFKWDDIKDEFIPFLEFLKSKYKLEYPTNTLDDILFVTNKGMIDLEIKNLIEDKIDFFTNDSSSLNNTYISDIFIYVEKNYKKSIFLK